jgi:hypothetical protein
MYLTIFCIIILNIYLLNIPISLSIVSHIHKPFKIYSKFVGIKKEIYFIIKKKEI